MDISMDIKGNGKDIMKSNIGSRNKPYKPPKMPPVTVKAKGTNKAKKMGHGTKRKDERIISTSVHCQKKKTSFFTIFQFGVRHRKCTPIKWRILRQVCCLPCRVEEELINSRSRSKLCRTMGTSHPAPQKVKNPYQRQIIKKERPYVSSRA